MDTTLREYLQQSDKVHEYIEKHCMILSNDILEDNVTQLQINIRNLQAVSKRLADVSNLINRIITCKKKITHSITYDRNIIDPYPTSNDHATLRLVYGKADESKEIVNNIKLLTKTVETLSDIPISSLYYVNSIKQYAININGIVISGNLANIVEYQCEQSARCEYGINCRSFKKQIPCKYYHDYNDWIKLKLPVPEQTRNFTIGSFVHSNSKKPSCYFTRHIGSKATLLHDIAMLKTIQYIDEVNNREGQLIHDLLIYLILHSKNLLEHYPNWLGKKVR
jgi:hypothetical protein